MYWDIALAILAAVLYANRKHILGMLKKSDDEDTVVQSETKSMSGTYLSFKQVEEVTQNESDETFKRVLLLSLPEGPLRERYREVVCEE